MRGRNTKKAKYKQSQEENLDSRTAWGTLDPTPAAAVKNIIDKKEEKEK